MFMEASLKKVHPGLPVVITVDALPGRNYRKGRFYCTAAGCTKLMWMNPDLRVYNTQISIGEEEPALRTGMKLAKRKSSWPITRMHCTCLCSRLFRLGEYVVYVVNGSSLGRRKVKVGLDNNRTIHILEGLQEGKRSCLILLSKKRRRPATGLGPKEGESASLLSEQIRRHLKEIESSVSTPQESVSSSQGDSASVGSRRQNTSDAQNQSFSQRDARRRRLENMTPEQMEEMRAVLKL